MKLNGNLVLNAGGSSQIENLVVEKLASLPVYSSAEKGRLVFNTTDGAIYYNNGKAFPGDGAYVAFATGGNAAALQTEVDAVETALGTIVLNDGSFNAAALADSVAAGATSLTDAILRLSAEITGNDTLDGLGDVDLSTPAEAGSVLFYGGSTVNLGNGPQPLWTSHTLTLSDIGITATTAELNSVTANLAAEVTRATGAEGTLTTNLAAEVTRATGAEGTLTTNLAAEVTRATVAEGVIATDLTTEIARATAAETAEAAARALADTTEATARATADTALQDAITTEAATRLAADNTAAGNLLAETAAREAKDLIHDTAIAARVLRAGDTMSGNLSFNDLYSVTGLAAPVNPGDAANKAYVDSSVAGLSWKNAVAAATSADVVLSGEQTIDGVVLVAGDRVLVRAQTLGTENGIYVVAAGAWTRSADADGAAELTNAAMFVQNGTTNADTAWVQTAPITTVGAGGSVVAFSQFSGSAVVQPGVGLSQTGATLNINLGAGIAELPTDGVGVDLYSGVSGSGLFLTTDGALDSSDAGAQLAVRLEGTTLTRSASGLKVADATILRITTAEGAITTEVADRIAADTALQTSITAETTRATAAEGALTTDLATEVTRATTAEGAIAASVSAETTRATAAEGVLTTNLSAEVTRATAAEGTLTTNLAAEVTRATAAEGVLTTNLSAEVTRATGAEAAINTKIAKGYYSAAKSSGTTWVVTHNIGSKFCTVTVVDSTDEVIIPQSIKFDSATQLTVTFNAAVAGTIVVMGLGV